MMSDSIKGLSQRIEANPSFISQINSKLINSSVIMNIVLNNGRYQSQHHINQRKKGLQYLSTIKIGAKEIYFVWNNN